MARRKPIHQAVPLARIQRRRQPSARSSASSSHPAVATVVYAFAATAILRDTPVHAAAIVPRPPRAATAPRLPAPTPAQGRHDDGAGKPTGPGLADPSDPAQATPDPLPSRTRPDTPPDPPSTGGTAEPEDLTGYQWPLRGRTDQELLRRPGQMASW